MDLTRIVVVSLIAAGLGAGVIQPTSAADIGSRYIAQAPMPTSWTGCYVGPNLGWAFGRGEVKFERRRISEPPPLLVVARLAVTTNSQAGLCWRSRYV